MSSSDDRIDALVPIFASMTRALRDAPLPEQVKHQALGILEAMGRDIGTADFGAQYTAMVSLVESDPAVRAAVAAHLPQLACLLH